MSGSTVEPHEKMKTKWLEESKPLAPRSGPRTSPAPRLLRPPTPLSPRRRQNHNQMRHCYDTYYEYHRCVEEKGAEAEACKKVADYYKSSCPDWIERWRIH